MDNLVPATTDSNLWVAIHTYNGEAYPGGSLNDKSDPYFFRSAKRPTKTTVIERLGLDFSEGDQLEISRVADTLVVDLDKLDYTALLNAVIYLREHWEENLTEAMGRINDALSTLNK